MTLMDWSVINSDNSLLMTYGEKDTDYKLMGKSRLERLQKRVACFSAFFGAAWLYPEPTENCESPGLIAALDDAAKAAGAMQGGEFVSLPSSSMRYARPGSDLMKAWDGAKRVSAGNIAFVDQAAGTVVEICDQHRGTTRAAVGIEGFEGIGVHLNFDLPLTSPADGCQR